MHIGVIRSAASVAREVAWPHVPHRNEPSAAEHMLRFFVEATASGTVNRS